MTVEGTAARRPVVIAASTAIVLAAGACAFVPWTPLFLTNYYEYAMHLAAAGKWQFGVDVLATYGPLGFIGLPFFDPATYPILIAANLSIYAASVLLLCRLWRTLAGEAGPVTIWAVLVVLVPAFGPVRYWAPCLFLPFTLVNAYVLQHLASDARRPSLAFLPFAALLAACVLMKATFIPLVFLAIAAVALDEAIVRRRLSWTVPVFAAALCAWWTLARQRFVNLPAYFVTTAEVVGGYKGGMGLGAPRSGAFAVLCGVAVLCFWLAISWTAWLAFGRRCAGFVAVFGASLLVLFQYAFARAGSDHLVAALLAVTSLGLLMIPLRRRASTAAVHLPPSLAAAMAVPAALLIAAWLAGLGRPVIRPLRERPPGMWSLLIHGTTPLRQNQARRLQALRQQYPLALADGTVDASAIDFALAEAYGRRLSILPTVSTPMAYTPALTRRNRDYLQSAGAPVTLFVAPDFSIDGRFPTVSDAQSVLAIKSHFEPAGRTRDFLIMRRRAQALGWRLVKLAERTVRISEPVAVPAAGGGPVWVSIDVVATGFGRLLGAVYQPAPYFISVDATGESFSYRLTTETVRDGMLLSPLLGDADRNASFFSALPSASRAIVSSVTLRGASGCAWCYADRARLVFFRVLFEP